MGKLINGINGSLVGRVGNIVGSTWKGIPYVKSRPVRRSKKATGGEAANREKFAMAQRWLSPLLDFVREGFRGYSLRAEGFVAAKSYLLRHAFVKDGDKQVINPALARVSYGDLPLPKNLAVTKTETNRLQFTWEPAARDDNSKYDQVMMLAYDIAKEQADLVTTGQFKSTGADSLQLTGDAGTIYHVYAAFVAADRSSRSDSVYMGEFTV